MAENDALASRFERERSQLRAVAYRMLGSLSEAEDAVQEAWLRLSRSDTSAIENLSAWLTTIVSRICLDHLRARASRREEPFDASVPEQAVGRSDSFDPEHETLLAESVGLAMLVVLDTLPPAERVAFVLHDMFDVPFDEIASILARTPAAARQLARRSLTGASSRWTWWRMSSVSVLSRSRCWSEAAARVVWGGLPAPYFGSATMRLVAH